MSASPLFLLDPADEYPHEPDGASNYNESMYFNAFDFGREVGGWFRIGNRVNEGHAEMSVCVYLDGGRVGFMYARPPIATNDAMDAGGLRIDVVTPLEQLAVTYDGTVCLLDDPLEMADPRRAFTSNPHVPCTVDLDFTGVAEVFGGRRADGNGHDDDPSTSFATAHYEQHVAATGSITVDDETIAIDGLGLRDKSWGPRYWQAIDWYRWLPISFGPDFGMTISLRGKGDEIQPGTGMVHHDGTYLPFTGAELDTEWDDDFNPIRVTARAETADRVYEVEGEVLSLIPLRNRRTDDAGNRLQTRIAEGMTRFTCGDRTGYGMSEYLDQIVDGRPSGPDAR